MSNKNESLEHINSIVKDKLEATLDALMYEIHVDSETLGGDVTPEQQLAYNRLVEDLSLLISQIIDQNL